MGRVGIRPNNLTFLGLALTVAAAWQLYAADHDGKPVTILPGVALMLLAGLADGGDGVVARAAGQTSVRGGFLDALTDRYSDSLLFSALLLGGWLVPLPQAPAITGEAWALAARIGALLTSYSRSASRRSGRESRHLDYRNAGAAGIARKPHSGAATRTFLAKCI